MCRERGIRKRGRGVCETGSRGSYIDRVHQRSEQSSKSQSGKTLKRKKKGHKMGWKVIGDSSAPAPRPLLSNPVVVASASQRCPHAPDSSDPLASRARATSAPQVLSSSRSVQVPTEAAAAQRASTPHSTCATHPNLTDSAAQAERASFVARVRSVGCLAQTQAAEANRV